MKPRFLTPPLAAMALLAALSAAELSPQPGVTVTGGANNIWNAHWQGTADRVYFLQTSTDLATWSFDSFMEYGTGIKSRQITSPAPKLFVRLVYYDDPNIESLEQAMNADFDGDGVSNFDEITVLGTNPTLFSTNGSGISDGAQDWDGDGISNTDEVALGLDPGASNTDGSSGAAAVAYGYDDKNRLTGMTSPGATASYDPDEEGNIE